MVDFVNFDTRAATWPMARPAAPVSPAVGIWPAAKINGESAAEERPAASEAPRPADPRNGEPSQQNGSARQTDESAIGPSGPFMAQRLAQQSEPEPELRPLRTMAMAAYLKTRDSHIQILRSVQTLDLRV